MRKITPEWGVPIHCCEHGFAIHFKYALVYIRCHKQPYFSGWLCRNSEFFNGKSLFQPQVLGYLFDTVVLVISPNLVWSAPRNNRKLRLVSTGMRIMRNCNRKQRWLIYLLLFSLFLFWPSCHFLQSFLSSRLQASPKSRHILNNQRIHIWSAIQF